MTGSSSWPRSSGARRATSRGPTRSTTSPATRSATTSRRATSSTGRTCPGSGPTGCGRRTDRPPCPRGRSSFPPRSCRITGSPTGNGAHWNRFIRPGDVMDAEISGLGRQTNRCVAAVANESRASLEGGAGRRGRES
jgi:hypothetical protein